MSNKLYDFTCTKRKWRAFAISIEPGQPAHPWVLGDQILILISLKMIMDCSKNGKGSIPFKKFSRLRVKYHTVYQNVYMLFIVGWGRWGDISFEDIVTDTRGSCHGHHAWVSIYWKLIQVVISNIKKYLKSSIQNVTKLAYDNL